MNFFLTQTRIEIQLWWANLSNRKKEVIAKRVLKTFAWVLFLVICSFTWKPALLFVAHGWLDNVPAPVAPPSPSEIYHRHYNECRSLEVMTEDQCHDIALIVVGESQQDDTSTVIMPMYGSGN